MTNQLNLNEKKHVNEFVVSISEKKFFIFYIYFLYTLKRFGPPEVLLSMNAENSIGK